MEELAILFVKNSIRNQISLAENFKNLTDRVYLFDSTGYFEMASPIVVNNIRALVREENYAVLGKTTQQLFDSDSFKWFCDVQIFEDNIGLFINL